MFGKVQTVLKMKRHLFIREALTEWQRYKAHWVTINYRESYNMFACNGILFNHESPVRGETFVTKKIVNALCKIKKGKQKKIISWKSSGKKRLGSC